MVSTQMLGAKGTAMIVAAASAYAPMIAGRRPTVSTNLDAGASAMAWATAATANAMPVQDDGPLSTSSTRMGTRAPRTPKEVQPWEKFARSAAR